MNTSSRLLQMLEPAVRPIDPGRTQAPSRPQSGAVDQPTTFEDSPFQRLMEMAQSQQSGQPNAQQTTTDPANSADAANNPQASEQTAKTHPLAPLNTIENASLVQLRAQWPTTPPEPTQP